MPIDTDLKRQHVSAELLEQYKKAVCDSSAKIKLIQFEESSAESRIDVESIYVDLMCEPLIAVENSLINEAQAVSCSTALILSEDQVDRKDKMNMVILGLPGAGKTTLLKFLLKKYSQQQKVVPIYLELKSEVDTDFEDVLKKEGRVLSADIKNYVVNYFKAKIGEKGDTLAQHIFSQLGQPYELVFFCDGLDEISSEQYKQFTAVVNKSSSFIGHSFIISSRQIGFFANDYNEKFKIHSLLDFNEEAQKQFIDKYFLVIGRLDIEYRKKHLMNLLEKRSDTVISKLASSPILLTLLCVTPNLKTIKNKAQLFESAIEVLLSNRKIATREHRVLFVKFLKELAVIFFKLDKEECFDQKELDYYADRFFCTQEDNDACKLLKSRYLDCGLFDKSEKANSFKFAHRTIWEYLVAVGMLDKDKNEIYSRSNMRVWEEPIKMFVSLVGQDKSTDVTQIIQKIWNENKSLALNCMNEFDPFPIDILNKLYGGLSRREKLNLVSTLRNSYIHYNGSFRNPVINTIKETLTLIHSVERNCEVIYSYLEFLSEFSTEKVFAELLTEFLQLETLEERQTLLFDYGLRFSEIAPGIFNMGRPVLDTSSMSDEERNRYIIVDAYEYPEHKVKITKAFKISRTLITNRMYFESGFPYADTSHRPNPYSAELNQPVNFVNWYEAMVFAKWFGYSLPSEAEWEFACRGKTGEDFMSNNIDELKSQLDAKANYTGDKTNKTRSVLPIVENHGNSHGLIDMIGNLREWCIDWFGEDYYSKCIIDNYPNFQDDIKGREEISYYWELNDKGIEIPYLYESEKKNNNANIITFDSEGNCLDPMQNVIEKIEAKSLRGGCFDWSISNLRPTYRNHNPANNVYKVNGFRVVKKGE